MYNSYTYYDKPANIWTEALPLGNGSIGAMVYGDIQNEKVSLNHDTLWTGTPIKKCTGKVYESFKKAKELTLEGRYEEAHKLINEKCLGERTQVYLPLGDININFDNVNKNYKNYKRKLNLEKSVAEISFECNGIKYKRDYFLSYPDNVLVIKISSDYAGKISFKLNMTSQLKSKVSFSHNMLTLDGECPGNAKGYNDANGYEYYDEPEQRGICFSAGISVINKGGQVSENNCTVIVKDADEAVLIFSAATSFNGFNKHPFVEGKEYRKRLINVIHKAADQGYDSLLKRHTDDYRDLFMRTRLYLGKSGREDWTTDKRLKKFKNDKNDISLYTLLFDFGRYLTISSSRRGCQASNLQGIWNNKLNPPWRSNYTLNINTEMNYWHVMMCSLDECFEPMIGLVQNAVYNGERTAQNIYNANGFVMHHNTDIWGHTNPVSGDAVYSFWNGASGWLCNTLWGYYEYTLDKEYLKEICYPIMKKAALFYLDLLTKRGDGKLSVCPATSPENKFGYIDDGVYKESAVAKYTTMSDAIAYELFFNCLKATEELNLTDVCFSDKLKYAVAKMQPFSLGEDGRLLEWNEDFCESDTMHRHISHLYGLHPAHLITVEDTPKLAGACRKTLEARGNGGTGWSLGWKINFWARLRDGNRALEFIDKQLNPVSNEDISYENDGGTYPNLFDAHPPFQIDGNFGAVSGILEMLVDSYDGKTVFLPALPDKWKEGSLSGIRVKGNKVYDIKWSDGKLLSVNERTETN